MHDSKMDWNELQEHRRKLSGEPDEQSIDRMVELWRGRLAADSDFSEEQLDEELVKLLEKIHHAF